MLIDQILRHYHSNHLVRVCRPHKALKRWSRVVRPVYLVTSLLAPLKDARITSSPPSRHVSCASIHDLSPTTLPINVSLQCQAEIEAIVVGVTVAVVIVVVTRIVVVDEVEVEVEIEVIVQDFEAAEVEDEAAVLQ